MLMRAQKERAGYCPPRLNPLTIHLDPLTVHPRPYQHAGGAQPSLPVVLARVLTLSIRARQPKDLTDSEDDASSYGGDLAASEAGRSARGEEIELEKESDENEIPQLVHAVRTPLAPL